MKMALNLMIRMTIDQDNGEGDYEHGSEPGDHVGKVKILPRIGLAFGFGALWRPLIGSRAPERGSNQPGAVGGIIWGQFQGSSTHLGASRGLQS